MAAIKGSVDSRIMPFALRRMLAEDVLQSIEIEREAFPTLFPPTSFRRELKNRKATYLVALGREKGVSNGANPWPVPGLPSKADRTLVGALLKGAQGLWGSRQPGRDASRGFIAGFVGIWDMVDEAHIVSVGVRREWRGRGVGELLLIGAIEQAIAIGSDAVSLEVRPSNAVARNLYRKYGFSDRGVRKGYYSDNREDAVIMTTDPIYLPAYQDRFRELQREHLERWGRAEKRG